MEISGAQAAVGEHYSTDDQIFLAALGRLVDALMRNVGDDEWCGKSQSVTDGMVFGYEESRSDYFVGQGVAFVLGNRDYIEPVSLEIWFNPDSKEMTRATILFGMLDLTEFGSGSRAASNLAQYVVIKARSGKPKVDFDWKYKFGLVDGTWSNEHLS